MNGDRQSISDGRRDGLNFGAIQPMITPQLRLALDNLYEVFARYDAPDYLGLDGNFQLRDLTVKQWHALGENHDMMVQMHNETTFRYFLPRWLEWLSEEEDARDDLRDWELWWLGYRLPAAHWQSWPADEVAALRALFAIWTREELAEYGGAPSHSWSHHEENLGDEGEQLGLSGASAYSELLHFLADIGDVAAYLERWLDTNLPQLARWLWIEDLSHHKGARDWITSSRLESELEAAFFADADGPDAPLFSRSIELVRSLKAM